MGIKSGILALMFFLLPQAELKTINGEVISIKDGDTFTIKDQRDKLYKVRLADIDAPEIGQPFGRPSKRLLEDLALNKTVRVNYTQVDKYGRLIAEVFLPDGKMLNEESLKAGLAWHYRVKYPHSTFLEKMEYKAWKKKVGLWVQNKPIPPWEFRRETRLLYPPTNPESMDYDLFLTYGIIGDPKTRVYLWPMCKGYPKSREGYIPFGNLLDAETLGYQAASGCKFN
ncbi:MAG: thermonuclease family protein [Nitrospinae bacterium]|nr:thermonuclease family protein [Nitrospinota bacterium]